MNTRQTTLRTFNLFLLLALMLPGRLGRADIDFNSDGLPDLLFQNQSTGQLVYWAMDGADYLDGAALPAPISADWKAVDSADFNGDSKADIVFQNSTTGQVVIWYMDGGNVIGGGAVSLIPSPGYQVVGAGDFNGDGHMDLVFEDSATGKIAFWFLNGLNVIGGATPTHLPSPPDPNNQVVGVADFNGDGIPDLVFQNRSTQVISFWDLIGIDVVGSASLSLVPSGGYSVVGLGDFNGDGKPDLLFQNTTTGQLVYWLLDGEDRIGGAVLPAHVTSGWHVAGLKSFVPFAHQRFGGTPPTPPFPITNKISGLGLSPFILSNQDPNQGTVVPEAQLNYLISDAAQYAVWIRTFGTSNTLQQAGLYIHQAGARAMIGAYLAAPNTPAAIQANQQELDRLVSIANAGEADIVTIGNETLLTGALTENQLLSYIAYVKARVPASVKVSTVDTWDELVNHPNVITAVDVVLANIYPFWENTPESGALARLQSDYATIQQASGTKQVMIAETGWPSSGSPPSQAPLAIPSAANQLDYFLGAEQWAKQNDIVMLWFDAFSEPWKANYNDFASWGIFDSNFVIEPQFASVFQ